MNDAIHYVSGFSFMPLHLSRKRFLTISGSALLVLVSCVSCGSTTPRSNDPTVVTAVGMPIRTSSVDHWISVFSAEINGGVPAVYDPPRFTSCVLTKRRQRGAWETEGTSLHAACQRERDQLRVRAVEFLVHGAWIRREAKRRGLVLTSADFQEAMSAERNQYPDEKTFRLARRGVGVEDNRERTALKALLEKIRAQAFPIGPLSEQRLRNFYESRKRDFIEPRTRRLRLVIVNSERIAQIVKEKLENGLSWEEVTARYSDDPITKRRGGRISIDVNNRIDPLRKAVFDARIESIVGPVEIRSKWWVFSVRGEQRQQQHTFEELRNHTLPSLVRQWWELSSLEKLVAQFKRRYRPHTICMSGSQFDVCGRTLNANRH